MNKYKILRPPLHPNFELPTRDELLALKAGDLVKLIFEVGDVGAERMWVILTDITTPEQWEGTLDNEPFSDESAASTKVKDRIKFHPLDIIATYE